MRDKNGEETYSARVSAKIMVAGQELPFGVNKKSDLPKRNMCTVYGENNGTYFIGDRNAGELVDKWKFYPSTVTNAAEKDMYQKKGTAEVTLYQWPDISYKTKSTTLGNNVKLKVLGSSNDNKYFLVEDTGKKAGDVYRFMFVEKSKVEEIKPLVTEQQLKAIGYKNVNSIMVEELNKTLYEFSITTKERIRHFLAQCFVETGQETIGGPFLTEISWHFPIDPEYERQYFDERKAYGYKYRGGGYIHLTWNGTYQDFSDYIQDPRVVSEGADYLASTPELAWRSAGWFWKEYKKLNNVVVAEDSSLDSGLLMVERVTKIVQGAQGALAERKAAYKKAREVIK